jgi:hypothetical protein
VDPAEIEHSIDPPYHVISWNHFIETECVEELPLTRCQPNPSCPAPDIDRFGFTESRFAAPINRVLQHNQG